jgi:RimJ/RimL family protein N-acetyltransferase
VNEETETKVLALLDVIAVEVAASRADIGRLDAKVASLDTKVASLDTKVTSLDTKVTSLDTKVTSLETRFDRVDQRLGRIETRVEGLETEVRTFRLEFERRVAPRERRRKSGFDLSRIEAPVLETDRLRLRPHRRDDFEACYAMWSDPIVMRFIGGKPSTEQQTWSRILNYAGLWALMGFGYWAVEDKASRAFIGEVGFADFHRDIDPAMRDVPELGWALVSHAHGRGFATEAVHAVLAWGDMELHPTRTVCLIDPENAASIRVAQKAGYLEFKRSFLNEKPVIFFERHDL